MQNCINYLGISSVKKLAEGGEEEEEGGRGGEGEGGEREKYINWNTTKL